MMNEREQRIGATSAKEQHTQTIVAIVTGVLTAGVLGLVGLLWTTSRDVLSATVRFDIQQVEQTQTLREIKGRMDSLAETVGQHETRISVLERNQFVEDSNRTPPERRRP